MTVACVGNMNNNLFALVRYLRDLGIEAHLLRLADEFPHFHPSADTFTLEYQRYTRTLDWGRPYDLHCFSRKRLAADLAPYEALIGCGSAPAYVQRAGRRLDVFVPYGADAYSLPFQKLVMPQNQLARCRFSRAQAAGIRASRYIQVDSTNETLERPLARLQIRGQRLNFGLPLVHTGTYCPETIHGYATRTHWSHEFRKIRENHQLVVFHQARHVWQTTSDLAALKGTDRLIRGFAQFLKRQPRVSAALVLLEYGPDVLATRQLAAQLGISEHVFWLPQMARKDLMVGLSMADIGTGEFHHSWLSCGSIYESLALAKPLLHYREDALYLDHYPELYPLLNARSPDEIAGSLCDYVARPDHYRAIGRRGLDWYQRYVVRPSLKAYAGILRAPQSGVPKHHWERRRSA